MSNLQEARTVVQRVKTRFQQPNSWIQHRFARTSPSGRSVDPIDPAAKCWCLDGAITVECLDPFLRHTVLRLIAHVIEPRSVPDIALPIVTHFNDRPGRTRDEVLALLDTVILVTGKGSS